MSMSKYVALLLAAGMTAFATTASYAEDSPHEFSANVTIATDYRFRGISQTDNSPTIQGGFDYAYAPLGVYLSAWASNVDFAESSEFDFYAGIAGEVNGIGWDVGGLYYTYPGDSTKPELDYFEVYGSLSYDFGMFDVTAGVAYSPDFFAETGDAVYVYGDVSIPLPHGFSISGHVGNQSIYDNVVFDTPDYTDWLIGVSKDIGKFAFNLSYVDTDLTKAECFSGSDLCDGTVVFSVSGSF